MDAKQFLAEFGHIANAPGGVMRLRELIFSLASDGRLLSDTESIEPIHLDKVTSFVMGQAPPGNECNTRGEGTIFVKTGEFGGLFPIIREWTTRPLKLAKQGDVLICVVGATVGKLNLAIDCAIGRSVAAIRPHSGLITKYLYFMLMPFTLRLRGGSRGSAQGVIGKAELSAIKLRVPTEDEQSRIVAKVDELMALCDKLEAQQQERRKLQNTLRQSILQSIASAQSPHELQDSWKRLEVNFGWLFSEAEDVEELQGLVRDLAIRGLLIEQSDTMYESEIDTLKLELVRDRLRKLKGIRASRLVSLPDDFEKPFQIPSGWKWLSLDQICYQITDGTHHTPQYIVNGVPFLSVKDISSGVIDFSSTKFISEEAHNNLIRRCKPERGDVLLTKVGTTGIAKAIDTDTPFSIFVSVALLKFPHEVVNPEFLELLISSPFVKKQSEDGTRGIGNKNLILNTIKRFAIPLPPLPDQQRILAKSSQLLKFCQAMKAQIEHINNLASRLAPTTISTLTGINLQQQADEPVKIPQTELIAPLRLGAAPDAKAQAPLATILAHHNGELEAKHLWQRFGGDIDAFYAQLKTEVAHGWIQEPAVAEMCEKPANATSA